MKQIGYIADCLEALGNPTRLAIYHLLVRAGEDGLPVRKIRETLDIPGSTLSHHLRHLDTANLVVRLKKGTTHSFTANYATMDSVVAFLTEECCVDAGLHSND